MHKIGILSDTHSYLDPSIFKYFENCDEIWHLGDFGNTELVNQLTQFKKLRAVYGNIDGHDIRKVYPEELFFELEGFRVYFKHIGGYPGRYAQKVKEKLISNNINLFLSGHSHILKVIPDKSLNLLHINPGAAGKEGFHRVRTIIRMDLNNKKIENMEVIELGLRAKIISNE